MGCNGRCFSGLDIWKCGMNTLDVYWKLSKIIQWSCPLHWVATTRGQGCCEGLSRPLSMKGCHGRFSRCPVGAWLQGRGLAQAALQRGVGSPQGTAESTECPPEEKVKKGSGTCYSLNPQPLKTCGAQTSYYFFYGNNYQRGGFDISTRVSHSILFFEHKGVLSCLMRGDAKSKAK